MGLPAQHPRHLGEQRGYNVHAARGQDLGAPATARVLARLRSSLGLHGTARGSAHSAHRLPADAGGHQPDAPASLSELWTLAGTIPPGDRSAGGGGADRARSGQAEAPSATGTTATNNMRAGPNVDDEICFRAGATRRPSWWCPTCLSDRLRAVGRPDPAVRDVGREGRRSATPSAAPSSGASRCRRWRGQVRPVAVHPVRQALQGRGSVAEELVAKKPEYRGKTLYTTCSTPTAR